MAGKPVKLNSGARIWVHEHQYEPAMEAIAEKFQDHKRWHVFVSLDIVEPITDMFKERYPRSRDAIRANPKDLIATNVPMYGEEVGAPYVEERNTFLHLNISTSVVPKARTVFSSP